MVEHSRRKFIARSLALGCSAAASPFVTPVTFAAAPWDNRLVVIILRGAMDGLDVVRPMGDKHFTGYRPDMVVDGMTDLNGFYAMHPDLSALTQMWQTGELGFVHAVSTPYRDKRSHFDGQDLLEAGFGSLNEKTSSSGWLNRMLTLVPESTTETAFAVGQEDLILLNGKKAFSNWSPGGTFALSSQARLLLSQLYESDPLFHNSAEIALDLTESADMKEVMKNASSDEIERSMIAKTQMAARKTGRAEILAHFAAERLNEETRIAAFSIGGWDTHRKQDRVIRRPLSELSRALSALKAGLGNNWNKTAVICMTEFGRTVRTNGTGGTDHGTGGAMVLAGGAIRGGKVYGDWPSLNARDLYKDRDLMPTADVREYAAHVMRGLFGIAQSDLEQVVFPGLDMIARPNVLL
jgi:uncharacterized protein (DUF1501 family)